MISIEISEVITRNCHIIATIVKNLNIKPMSTYSDVLSQAQNLTLEEQQQLLEVLSALVRDRVTTQTHGKRSEIDAALIEMAQDPEYQSQVLQMEAKFRRQRTVEILEKIAASNVYADINDPVEWQRELRQDRSLPGRAC